MPNKEGKFWFLVKQVEVRGEKSEMNVGNMDQGKLKMAHG